MLPTLLPDKMTQSKITSAATHQHQHYIQHLGHKIQSSNKDPLSRE